MDPLLVGGIIVLGIVALFLLTTRRVKNRPLGGRDDKTERPELTGTEQYKHREPK